MTHLHRARVLVASCAAILLAAWPHASASAQGAPDPSIEALRKAAASVLSTEDTGDSTVHEAQHTREAAGKEQPYPGNPGEGKKLGFANIFGTLPFCISVENNIIYQAKLAGFSEDDMIIMDNQYDSVLGLKNADIMLAQRPDFFIEFQSDAKVNNIVAQNFGAAGSPILAIDVPVPGSPLPYKSGV